MDYKKAKAMMIDRREHVARGLGKQQLGANRKRNHRHHLAQLARRSFPGYEQPVCLVVQLFHTILQLPHRYGSLVAVLVDCGAEDSGNIFVVLRELFCLLQPEFLDARSFHGRYEIPSLFD